ncbi:MAG: hypothetical protein CL398_00100 [Acidiferrobacteraceae bacterium]|nr:hypothetical protein [Acidiferrobacteraceae bacterium]|tara:strand:+ start:743 stop:1321 length:579 start_codon:yes stop_codon:yes gene_type:complete
MAVDFAELRNQILFGESEGAEERPPSPAMEEWKDNKTRGLAIVGITFLGFGAFEAMKGGLGIFKAKSGEDGELSEDGHNYLPVLIPMLGVLPFGIALGRMWRGLSCQDEIERYEKLVQAAEEEVERHAEEAVEKAAEDAAHAESHDMLYNSDYFQPSIAGFDFGTMGAFGPAIGQTPVSYSRSDSLGMGLGW